MAENNKIKPRKKPSQARSKVTVDAIYESALQQFTLHGFNATTTDKIAERAGVSIGTLYQYFPNKETILVELWEQVFDAVVIGGKTHSLKKPDLKQTEKLVKQYNHQPDDHLFNSVQILSAVIGNYSGKLSGFAEGSIFNIGHKFKFKSIWEFDVGEKELKLVIKKIPVIDKIIGTGSIDPQTGMTDMIFEIPFFKKLYGTGRINPDLSFSFTIPRVSFKIDGKLKTDVSVSGTWEFDFSFIILKFSASGNMAGGISG